MTELDLRPVNTVARRDLRYALARSTYVADYAGIDPDAAYARRVTAAAEMHSIDREYAAPPSASFVPAPEGYGEVLAYALEVRFALDRASDTPTTS